MFIIRLKGIVDGEEIVYEFGSDFIPRKGEEIKLIYEAKTYSVVVNNVSYLVDCDKNLTQNFEIEISFS